MYKQVLNTDGEYGAQFVQDLLLPESHKKPEVLAKYAQYAKRIHWLDDDVVPGSIQMNTSWYLKPNRPDDPEAAKRDAGMGSFKEHTHDSDEILGFYGTDPDDPYNLFGEIELFIEGESHILTKSTMVFLPAGMEHCPLYINKLERPIFHFSLVMESKYTMRHGDEGGELLVAE